MLVARMAFAANGSEESMMLGIFYQTDRIIISFVVVSVVLASPPFQMLLCCCFYAASGIEPLQPVCVWLPQFAFVAFALPLRGFPVSSFIRELLLFVVMK